ncbi:hypothetical protein CAPTEDRAFT_210506 [Capitella teleta]|uniref:Uncharacterized protein n=1 Tax=Capitella teleta TaxID=283909 RepID=R7VL16_CAPTE|nr:hypothetical protein CAPTEDRAFT_210506 [Capitella teleta]|eukprot:ELU17215.1 hypothetical protein CAPTEDRAFT_210506 [Capitella teleta]
MFNSTSGHAEKYLKSNLYPLTIAISKFNSPEIIGTLEKLWKLLLRQEKHPILSCLRGNGKRRDSVPNMQVNTDCINFHSVAGYLSLTDSPSICRTAKSCFEGCHGLKKS